MKYGRRRKHRQHAVESRPAKPPLLPKRTTEWVIVIVLLCFASALILSNLGNIYLWQDEAQTALIAKTILTHGVPLGYDGKNHFSQLFGAEYGPHYIWKWHPWLPFYVLAGFFAVLGTSTFVARLPFALFGIATIILTYFCGKSLWKIRRAGILAAIVLTTSVPFLLLVRQCRYYAPVAFFSLAGLYAYSEMLERRKYASVAFILSAIFLFHTLYIYFGALIVTVIAHVLLCRRDRLKSVLMMSGIAIAVCLPWIGWLKTVGQTVIFGDMAHRIAVSSEYYGVQIVKHVFNPALLAIPIAVFLFKGIGGSRTAILDGRSKSSIVLLVLFSVVTFAGIMVANQYPFFRYMAPLIPVLCLLAGLILEQGMRIHPAVGIAIILLLGWRGHMGDYFYEITHDYDGPVEKIVQFLNQNAKPGDIVAVNQEDLPIKWYTGLQVIGGDTGEDFSAAEKANWVIFRPFIYDVQANYMTFLAKTVRSGHYTKTAVFCPALAFENREDVGEHAFRTVKTMRNVNIYHRVEE